MRGEVMKEVVVCHLGGLHRDGYNLKRNNGKAIAFINFVCEGNAAQKKISKEKLL